MAPLLLFCAYLFCWVTLDSRNKVKSDKNLVISWSYPPGNRNFRGKGPTCPILQNDGQIKTNKYHLLWLLWNAPALQPSDPYPHSPLYKISVIFNPWKAGLRMWVPFSSLLHKIDNLLEYSPLSFLFGLLCKCQDKFIEYPESGLQPRTLVTNVHFYWW